MGVHLPGRRYRALTSFSLEGEPISGGELLSQQFTDEPGNQYILDRLVETGTIVLLPDLGSAA
jgi:hypothetical protein